MSKSELCSRCGQKREKLSRRYCRLCHNEYMRLWRKTHTLTQEQRFKNNVRAKTHMRIYRGLLIPEPCEVCANPKVEAHHDDYNKPYNVRWMCFVCHRNHHKDVYEKGTKRLGAQG